MTTSTVKIKALINAICKLYTDTYERAVSIPILKIAFLKHVLCTLLKYGFLFH